MDGAADEDRSGCGDGPGGREVGRGDGRAGVGDDEDAAVLGDEEAQLGGEFVPLLPWEVLVAQDECEGSAAQREARPGRPGGAGTRAGR
nr:hypothetical protein GCM10025732_20400 [Glycomyces mayteni]